LLPPDANPSSGTDFVRANLLPTKGRRGRKSIDFPRSSLPSLVFKPRHGDALPRQLIGAFSFSVVAGVAP